MRPENRILALIGCGGALQLHLPSEKSPLRYLADAPTLISLSEMRSGIPNRNKTALPSTHTGLTQKEFYDPGINREIAIRELEGVGALMIS